MTDPVTTALRVRCQARNLKTGKRECPHPAKFVIRAPYDELLVCGVHRRGWLPKASYPLGKAALSF